MEGLAKPVHKDDPALVNGNLQGIFVDYVNAPKSFVEDVEVQHMSNIPGYVPSVSKEEEDAPTFE